MQGKCYYMHCKHVSNSASFVIYSDRSFELDFLLNTRPPVVLLCNHKIKVDQISTMYFKNLEHIDMTSDNKAHTHTIINNDVTKDNKKERQ